MLRANSSSEINMQMQVKHDTVYDWAWTADTIILQEQ